MAWTEWEKTDKFGFKDIIYERRYHSEGGGVERIRLNRPKVMNYRKATVFLLQTLMDIEK